MGVLLAAAVASSGLELTSWSLVRVYSRPYAESSGRYRVRAGSHELTLVASTRVLSDSERSQLGAVRCESGVGSLHIWAYPADPELPGLPVVEDHAELARRLAPLLETELSVASTELVVLRPLRRAVYRVVATSRLGHRTVFLKVVRPHKMAELAARHRACTLIPPTADLGDGILAIDQAPGTALTDLLHLSTSPNPGLRVDPQVILSALNSLTERALQVPPRTPPSARFASFSQPLVAGGADSARVQNLVARIQNRLMTPESAPVPTHGDFHPANLFLAADASAATALIDGDTVGPGHQADDIAMMFAHLLVLPSYDAPGYPTVPQLVSELWHTCASIPCGPGDLVARTAASMISLAPGARSPQQLNYYLAAAEQILSSGAISVLPPQRE